MTQDEIKKIAIEMVKKKHGNWYKMGDESEVYYGGIIDGINKVLNDPNAFANVIQSIYPSQQDIECETAGLCESDQLYEGFISGIDYMSRRIKEKAENILL